MSVILTAAKTVTSAVRESFYVGDLSHGTIYTSKKSIRQSAEQTAEEQERVNDRRGNPDPINYDKLADAMAQRPMVLKTPNGRVIAQMQAKDNAQASNRHEQSFALGVGK